MKHSIEFIDEESGEFVLISSSIYGKDKKLVVAVRDNSEKGYRVKNITVIQHVENDKKKAR